MAQQTQLSPIATPTRVYGSFSGKIVIADVLASGASAVSIAGVGIIDAAPGRTGMSGVLPSRTGVSDISINIKP